MPNIVITRDGDTVIADNDGTRVEWSNSAATVSADGNTRITIVQDGTPVMDFVISDIVSIDGAKPYGNAGDVVLQITNESTPTGGGWQIGTTAEREALTPTEGDGFYDTTLHGLFIYTGSQWEQL